MQCIRYLRINPAYCILHSKEFNLNVIIEASRGAAPRGVTVKPTGCGFDPHSRRWNIYLNLYFHFFALVSRLSRCWVLPLNRQCLQNSAESGECNVSTLGSLCLPCCVRDFFLNFLSWHNRTSSDSKWNKYDVNLHSICWVRNHNHHISKSGTVHCSTMPQKDQLKILLYAHI